ncbi:MAG: hypothetical protein ACWA41_06815 [Putridiphycobacter sp.]
MKHLKFIPILFILLLFSCNESEEKSLLEKALYETRVNPKKGEQQIPDSLGNFVVDLIDNLDTSNIDYSYTYINEKGNFKITFPVKTVLSDSIIQIIDDEKITIYTYEANMENTDHINEAYHFDYLNLDKVYNQKERDAYFNEQREFLISAFNASMEFEKVINLNGAEGRHYLFIVDESHIHVNYKIYIKENICYKLSVVTEEGNLFNPLINDFFDSFEITE